MSLVYKRVYVDIPTETHAKLVALASERGMSQKSLLAELIEAATSSKPQKGPTKRRAKRGSKKR